MQGKTPEIPRTVLHQGERFNNSLGMRSARFRPVKRSCPVLLQNFEVLLQYERDIIDDGGVGANESHCAGV